MPNVKLISITKVVYYQNAITMNIEVDRDPDDDTLQEITIKGVNALVDIDNKLREMKLETEPPQPNFIVPTATPQNPQDSRAVELTQKDAKKPEEPKNEEKPPKPRKPHKRFVGFSKDRIKSEGFSKQELQQHTLETINKEQEEKKNESTGSQQTQQATGST